MKRYIITAVATALLSSCGIYNRYTSVTDVPEDLYGNQVEVTDTIHNLGNMDWRNLFTDPYLQSLIQQGGSHTLVCEIGIPSLFCLLPSGWYE